MLKAELQKLRFNNSIPLLYQQSSYSNLLNSKPRICVANIG